MSGDPRSEFLVRDSNHRPSALPAPKAVNRKRAVSHHPVGGSPADSQFPLNFARAQQAIVRRQKREIDSGRPVLFRCCRNARQTHDVAPFLLGADFPFWKWVFIAPEARHDRNLS